MDERLVAVEEAVAAREQIALEPALALVLGEHLHHAPVRREVLVGRLDGRVPRAVRDGEDVTESVRGGLVRPEQTEVGRVADDHVAQEAAENAGRLAECRSRLRHVDGVRDGSRAARARAAARRRSRAGSRSCAARRPARARVARAAAGRTRRTAPPAGSSAATSRAPRGGPASSRAPATGTWCERQVPSTCTPSTSRGPVQPFGVRSTIIGQRGPLARRGPRAQIAGSHGSRRAPRRAAAAKRWCASAGGSSSPLLTNSGRQP